MALVNDLANATVRIEFSTSRGSGFHFWKPEIIVTNHHVIDGAEADPNAKIFAITERDERISLQLLAFSHSLGGHLKTGH